jgi:nucleoside-diphosphate-sugar epimerase
MQIEWLSLKKTGQTNLFTTDLANIIAALMNSKLPKLSIFNVGNLNSMTAEQWVQCCAEAAGTVPRTIMYDYAVDGRTIRDFFPFPDYENILNVGKIKSIYNLETDIKDGLHNAYKWYLENRDNILFKENVTRNEAEILHTLKWSDL